MTMEIVQANTQAMLIINSNDEAVSYIKWKPGTNTYLYYNLISNANDGSGNSRNGTVSGTVSRNNGAVFSGSGKILSVDSLPTTFTISVWLKKTYNSGSEQVVFAKWNTNSTPTQYQRFGVIFNGSTLRVYQATSSTTHQWNDVMTINDSNRHNIVYVYDNGTVKVYVDKVLKGTYSTTVSNSVYSGLGLGGWYGGATNFYGIEREFIVESVARSQTDVEEYYDKTVGKL